MKDQHPPTLHTNASFADIRQRIAKIPRVDIAIKNTPLQEMPNRAASRRPAPVHQARRPDRRLGRYCTYRQALNYVWDYCDFLTAADRRKIFHDNSLSLFAAPTQRDAHG